MMVALLALAALTTPSASAGEVLTHYDALCADTGALGPAAGEESHRAVSRLTTVDVPFSVTHVKARLHHGSTGGAMCDASLPRVLTMWKSTEEAPEGAPTGVVSVNFPAEEVLGEERVVEADLPSPIVLNEGEYLWASIDFGGAYPNVGCIKTCRADSAAGLHFWSNNGAEPYEWVDLAALGAGGAMWIEVTGEPPAGVLPERPVAVPVETEPEADDDGGSRRRRRR